MDWQSGRQTMGIGAVAIDSNVDMCTLLIYVWLPPAVACTCITCVHQATELGLLTACYHCL